MNPIGCSIHLPRAVYVQTFGYWCKKVVLRCKQNVDQYERETCPKVKDVRYTCLSSICPKLFDTRAKRYEALQCTPSSCHATEAATATPSPTMAQIFLQLLVLILLMLGWKNPAKTQISHHLSSPAGSKFTDNSLLVYYPQCRTSSVLLTIAAGSA